MTTEVFPPPKNVYKNYVPNTQFLNRHAENMGALGGIPSLLLYLLISV